MVEAATKLTPETDDKEPEEKATRSATPTASWPFASPRREIDRLFGDFAAGPWRLPARRGLFAARSTRPRAVLAWRDRLGQDAAVDIAETTKGYEITAELPGMDERNIEVKYADGTLTIKGEKKEEKEAALWFISALVQRAGWRRRRQGRSNLQEWRVERDLAEDGRSTEEREADRDQEGLIVLKFWHNSSISRTKSSTTVCSHQRRKVARTRRKAMTDQTQANSNDARMGAHIPA
jgi:HSP20 family molecular chaperone IbpA